MAALADGASVEVAGSGSNRYTLSRKGEVYACTCPAWRNQGGGLAARTCKHLKAYLGADAEAARVGATATTAATATGGAPARAARTAAVAKDGAPPLLLAHAWKPDVAPDGWWMSEKLDGIRAYWDGAGFWSRLGNRFAVPPWFAEGLPDHPLDGELWIGRKQFQRTTSVVRSGAGGEAWRQVRYVVFDAPAAPGSFEARMDHVRRALARAAPRHAAWHEHVRCEGVDHLRAELARVEALGGEGLMLRQPGSPYHVGRSTSLLKVKTFHDAEARVVGHSRGAGKHAGRLGALEVELADGTRFSVGTGLSDDERRAPPPIGAIITFRYQELSDDGVPRFPTYVGVRIDAALPPRPTAARAPRAARPAARSSPAPAAVPAPVPAPDPDPDPDPDPAPDPSRPASLSTARPSLVIALEQGGVPGKFWTVEVRGSQHVVRSGARGTTGQTRLTACASPAAARADAEKRAAAKRKDGYRDVTS